MKREDALKLSERLTADLAESLKAGKSDQLVKYLDVLATFHSYSFGNVMMIFAQKPDSTRVAGFHTWKKLGRFVRKGEKGIAIFAPMMFKQKDEDESDGNGKRVLRGFKVVHVYDVSQTDGEDLPELAAITGDPGEHLAALEDVTAELGITLKYEQIPGGAEGLSKGGEIVVLPDLEPAEDFAILAHELSHELLHRDERREQTDKTIRETEAEAVAYVVVRAVGLEPSTRSSDYIQLYRGTVETLTTSLDHVQRVSTRILTALEMRMNKQVSA